MSFSRRFFLHTVGSVLAAPAIATAVQDVPGVRGAGRAGGPADSTPPRTDALPLRTTGIEHLGIMVPDVEKSGRFYGQVFSPQLYREKEPPLRYYATLGVGYIAIGALRSGLAAAGATVEPTDGADLIRFRDPDGIVIELNGRS